MKVFKQSLIFLFSLFIPALLASQILETEGDIRLLGSNQTLECFTSSNEFNGGIRFIGDLRLESIGYIEFLTTDGGVFFRRMTLLNNGNFGIGISSPEDPLSFNNVVGTKINLFDDGTGIYGFGIGSAELQIGTYDASKHISLGHYSGSSKNFVEWMQINAASLKLSSGAYASAGGVWTNASSREYKENISYISYQEALDGLMQLVPVKYNYKTQKEEQYAGFIAEDVPEIVATNDRKSLSTMDITAILTKVVQAQQRQILQMNEEITTLKVQLSQTATRND